MKISLNRILLYVQNVELLKEFYTKNLSLEVVESIPSEWAVLKAGQTELALHWAGEAYRAPIKSGEGSNAKLVFTIEADLNLLREKLLKNGVEMREIKSYRGFPYQLCDGVDPEGNVFQFMQPT